MSAYNNVIEIRLPYSEEPIDFSQAIKDIEEELNSDYCEVLDVNFTGDYSALINIEHEEEYQLYEVIGCIASSLTRYNFSQFSFSINNCESND